MGQPDDGGGGLKIFLCLDWTSANANGRWPLLGIGQFHILMSAASLWQKTGGRRLWTPRLPPHREFILDSGAFSLLSTMSDYPFSLQDYLDVAGKLGADYIAARDWPCEPFGKIKIPVEERIQRTVEADVEIIEAQLPWGSSPLPVIQGWTPTDYIHSIDLLKERGAITDYMAVGSVCKRSSTREMMEIARAVRTHLPDRVKLHFFGLKTTAFKQPGFTELAHSVDTGAWAFAHIYYPFVAGRCSFCGKAQANGGTEHLHMLPRAEERVHRLYSWLARVKITPQASLERFNA